MRIITTFLLVSLAFSAIADPPKKYKVRPFQVRCVSGIRGTFDTKYTTTTIDMNGVELVTMGTVDNIITAGYQIGNVAGQIRNLVNGSTNITSVWKEDDVTYYKYGDNILAERTRETNVPFIVAGVEGGFYSKPFSMAVGLRNSKYRYIAPDFYFETQFSPMWAFIKGRDAFTGFTYFRDNDIPKHIEWLGLFHVGFMAGWDGGMPGFLNFDERGYNGVLGGFGSTVGRVSWAMDGFMQKNGRKMQLNQSHIRFIISVAL